MHRSLQSDHGVLATRQVPLGLGWAMSVHKSQGLTLDRAEVSLERAFEPGMACVPLARHSMQTLNPVMATVQWCQTRRYSSATRACYVVHMAQRPEPAVWTAPSSLHVHRPQHACLAEEPYMSQQVCRPQPSAEPGGPAAHRRRHPPQSPGRGSSSPGVLPAP